jgi:formylglycine-generating enzyme required for sulfatase activity
VEEWEFAARSRGDDSRWLEDERRCDYSKPAEQCPRNGQKKAATPCSIDSPRTAEGLCDMFGNLAELITTTPRSPRGEYAAGWAYGLGGLPWGHDGIYTMPRRFDFRQRPWTGFRCARSPGSALTERDDQ